MVWAVIPAVEGAAGNTATTRPARRAVTDGEARCSVGRGAGPDVISPAGHVRSRPPLEPAYLAHTGSVAAVRCGVRRSYANIPHLLHREDVS
jgi:hypothetical protein